MPPTPELMETARRLLDDLAGSQRLNFLRFEHIKALPATAAILGADPPTQIAIIRQGIDRIARMRDKELQYDLIAFIHEPSFPWEAHLAVCRLLRRKLPWTSEELAYLVKRIADLGIVCLHSVTFLPLLVNVVERELQSCPMTDELRQGLVRLEASIVRRYRAAERRLCEQLSALANFSGNRAPA